MARPMRYQPQGAARLDRSNPLGRKVIHHISLAGQPQDLVTGTRGAFGSGGTITPGAKGLSLRGSGSAARGNIILDLSARNKITMAWWMYWDAYANDDGLAMEYGSPNYSGAVGSGILIDPNASGIGGMFLAGLGGNSGNNLVAFARPSAGVWHRITMSLDCTTGSAASTQVWVDGIAQSLSFPIPLSTVGTTFTNSILYFLCRSDTSLFGTGNLQDITIYDGILTDAEARSDASNPWQIFSAGEDWDDPPTAGGGITGTLASTLGNVTLSAAGTTPIAGASAKTLGAVTLAGAGTTPIAGTASKTLGNVTLAGAGAAPAAGALAKTLGDVALAATGTVSAPGSITGTLAVTLGAVGLAAAGTAPIAGAAAKTLGNVTLTATGTATESGTLARTLGDVTLSATGTVTAAGAAIGTLAVTLGNVALMAAGTAPIVGAAAPALGNVTLAGAGATPEVGTLAKTLGAVSLAGTGTVSSPITGTANITLGNITLVASDRVATPAYYQDAGGDDAEDHREFYARIKKDKAKREATTVEPLEKIEQLPKVEQAKETEPVAQADIVIPISHGLAQPTPAIAAKPPIVNDYAALTRMIMDLLPEMFEEEELE